MLTLTGNWQGEKRGEIFHMQNIAKFEDFAGIFQWAQDQKLGEVSTGVIVKCVCAAMLFPLIYIYYVVLIEPDKTALSYYDLFHFCTLSFNPKNSENALFIYFYFLTGALISFISSPL